MTALWPLLVAAAICVPVALSDLLLALMLRRRGDRATRVRR